MESQESRRLATILAQSAGVDTSAMHIADAIVSIWQDIDTALRPIIGQGGVAALYKRSLYLCTTNHPWLAGTYEGVPTSLDLSALRAVLVKQNRADAAAAGATLLQILYELLISLVGPSLTEQLLRSVWANSFRGFPAQDTSS